MRAGGEYLQWSPARRREVRGNAEEENEGASRDRGIRKKQEGGRGLGKKGEGACRLEVPGKPL